MENHEPVELQGLIRQTVLRARFKHGGDPSPTNRSSGIERRDPPPTGRVRNEKLSTKEDSVEELHKILFQEQTPTSPKEANKKMINLHPPRNTPRGTPPMPEGSATKQQDLPNQSPLVHRDRQILKTESKSTTSQATEDLRQKIKQSIERARLTPVARQFVVHNSMQAIQEITEDQDSSISSNDSNFSEQLSSQPEEQKQFATTPHSHQTRVTTNAKPPPPKATQSRPKMFTFFSEETHSSTATKTQIIEHPLMAPNHVNQPIIIIQSSLEEDDSLEVVRQSPRGVSPFVRPRSSRNTSQPLQRRPMKQPPRPKLPATKSNPIIGPMNQSSPTGSSSPEDTKISTANPDNSEKGFTEKKLVYTASIEDDVPQPMETRKTEDVETEEKCGNDDSIENEAADKKSSEIEGSIDDLTGIPKEVPVEQKAAPLLPRPSTPLRQFEDSYTTPDMDRLISTLSLSPRSEVMKSSPMKVPMKVTPEERMNSIREKEPTENSGTTTENATDVVDPTNKKKDEVTKEEEQSKEVPVKKEEIDATNDNKPFDQATNTNTIVEPSFPKEIEVPNKLVEQTNQMMKEIPEDFLCYYPSTTFETKDDTFAEMQRRKLSIFSDRFRRGRDMKRTSRRKHRNRSPPARGVSLSQREEAVVTSDLLREIAARRGGTINTKQLAKLLKKSEEKRAERLKILSLNMSRQEEELGSSCCLAILNCLDIDIPGDEDTLPSVMTGYSATDLDTASKYQHTTGSYSTWLDQEDTGTLESEWN